AVEGNRIRLSRKAILKEQRAKMGGGGPAPEGGSETGAAVEAPAHAPALTIEGGGDFPDEPEPNFNRDTQAGGGERPNRGFDRGGRGGRPGGGRGRGGRGRNGRGGHGGHHGGHGGHGGGHGGRH